MAEPERQKEQSAEASDPSSTAGAADTAVVPPLGAPSSGSTDAAPSADPSPEAESNAASVPLPAGAEDASTPSDTEPTTPAATRQLPVFVPGARTGIFVAERAQPLSSEKRSAKEVAAEAVGDVSFRLRRRLAEGIDDIRRLDRWMRWKSAILIGWLLLSVLSLRVATSGPADPASNSLDAYVALTRTSMSWALLVENRSDDPWEEIRVKVNGRWIHERDRLEPGDNLVLGPLQLRDGDELATSELKVENVEIRTRDGSARPDIVR